MLMDDDSSSDEDHMLEDTQVLHVGTPLIHSTHLSLRLNSNIFLKMESIQPSGSVKIRGIGNFCYRKIQTRGNDVRFVSGSGINTALAVAYCARQLRAEATIVVPTKTSQRICEAIQLDGAQLIKYGSNWIEAETHARKLVKRNGVYVPSADHEHVWQGHSSIVHELKTQLMDNPPAAIICPVGGGGLLNGVILGLQQVGWKQVPVIAVETHGSNAFQAAVVTGCLVHLPKTSTLASSLEAKSVCAKTLELSLIHPVVPFAVSDAMSANAVRLFADDNKMLVEASSGAALSLCYTEIIRDILPSLSPSSDIVVLVTGGSDISLDHLDEYRKLYDSPPVVVKSGSDVFLRLDDTLISLDDVDIDEPMGISPALLQELRAKRAAELSSQDQFDNNLIDSLSIVGSGDDDARTQDFMDDAIMARLDGNEEDDNEHGVNDVGDDGDDDEEDDEDYYDRSETFEVSRGEEDDDDEDQHDELENDSDNDNSRSTPYVIDSDKDNTDKVYGDKSSGIDDANSINGHEGQTDLETSNKIAISDDPVSSSQDSSSRIDSQHSANNKSTHSPGET